MLVFFALSSASAQNSTKWYVTKCDYLEKISVVGKYKILLEVSKGSDLEDFDKIDTASVPKQVKIFWAVPVAGSSMATGVKALYVVEKIYRENGKIYVLLEGTRYPEQNSESHSVRFLERGT